MSAPWRAGHRLCGAVEVSRHPSGHLDCTSKRSLPPHGNNRYQAGWRARYSTASTGHFGTVRWRTVLACRLNGRRGDEEAVRINLAVFVSGLWPGCRGRGGGATGPASCSLSHVRSNPQQDTSAAAARPGTGQRRWGTCRGQHLGASEWRARAVGPTCRAGTMWMDDGRRACFIPPWLASPSSQRYELSYRPLAEGMRAQRMNVTCLIAIYVTGPAQELSSLLDRTVLGYKSGARTRDKTLSDGSVAECVVLVARLSLPACRLPDAQGTAHHVSVFISDCWEV